MPGLEPTTEFLEAARTLGIEFEPGDPERLGDFLGVLFEANKTTNLTSITEPAEAWMRHIFDALTIVPVLASLSEAMRAAASAAPESGQNGEPAATRPPAARNPDALAVIDIGSGGGLPAIPLAIVLPKVKFTLVEATGKKVDFLRQAAKQLKLSNVSVVQDRAEIIGQDHKVHREKYDVAMARALGHLAIVVELCGPLVVPGGVLVAVKGAKADQEVIESGKAMGLVGVRHTTTIATPTGRLVVMEKTTRTPRSYPRRDGEPARLPLGLVRPAAPQNQGKR